MPSLEQSPESAPLTEAEVDGIDKSLLQGAALIAFLRDFVAFNANRKGNKLSNTALFFSYSDSDDGNVVWVTPEEVPPAQPLPLPLPLPLSRPSLAALSRSLSPPLALSLSPFCRAERSPLAQVLANPSEYCVEKVLEVMYFPVHEQPQLNAAGATRWHSPQVRRLQHRSLSGHRSRSAHADPMDGAGLPFACTPARRLQGARSP